MKNFRFIFLCLITTVVLSSTGPWHACFAADHTGKVGVTVIDLAPEDKEVGLERMRLLDKALSQELLDRKLRMVSTLEAQYNRKLAELIDGIIPPVFDNKVLTHIDVNFFATDFDKQIRASQNVAMTIILHEAGFERWKQRYATSEEAQSAIKKLVVATFKIPEKNVTLMVTD